MLKKRVRNAISVSMLILSMMCFTSYADDKPVAEMKLLLNPNRTIYEPGESVDLYGAIVKLVYTDGTSETAKISDLEAGGFDMEREGSQLGYIAYGEYKCPLAIEVRKGCLTRIRASLNRTNLVEGMSLTKDMFTVIGDYDIGTSKEIFNYDISYNTIKAGNNEVKIIVGDIQTSVTVSARENKCEKIEIISPGKQKFLIGEYFDYTGLKVNGTFTDGSVRDVTGQCEVKGITTTQIGNYHVTVKCENQLATYKVDVYKLVCNNIDVSLWDTESQVILTFQDIDEPVTVSDVVIDNDYKTRIRTFYISYLGEVFTHTEQIPDEQMMYSYSKEISLEVPIGINYRGAGTVVQSMGNIKFSVICEGIPSLSGIYSSKGSVAFNMSESTDNCFIPFHVEVLN